MKNILIWMVSVMLCFVGGMAKLSSASPNGSQIELKVPPVLNALGGSEEYLNMGGKCLAVFCESGG